MHRATIASFLLLLALPSLAAAHSTVSPSEVPTSRYQTFTLSVPTERDLPTTEVRLLIPEGLDRVTPFVKPGWDISITKDPSGERVTEIFWRGGSIPAGQKDVFEFTGRTPSASASLVWKAYQRYADGSLVAWDRDPASGGDGETVPNPYSMTAVIEETPAEAAPERESAALLPIISLALSALALGIVLLKK